MRSGQRWWAISIAGRRRKKSIVRAAYLRLREEMELGSLAAERPIDAAIVLEAIRRVDFGLFHVR